MTIKSKLSLVNVLVVFFSLMIILFTGIKALEERTSLIEVGELNILSTKLSLLIHETQKERGASAGFLGSKGTKFSDILPKQRTLTDKRNRELEAYINTLDLNLFSDELQKVISSFRTDMSKVTSIRAKVDSLAISVKDEVKYYTGMNAKILNIVGLTAKLATNPELVKSLNAYTNFLKSKERAGIERAVLSATFAADKFGTGIDRKSVV